MTVMTFRFLEVYFFGYTVAFSGYEGESMRDNIIRVRLSDTELEKIKRLASATGVTGMAEVVRLYLDKAYDQIVILNNNK